MIYLDYASTTPMSSTAVKVYTEVARRYFGNSSSLHDFGSEAGRVLQKARSQFGTYLGGPSRGIYFTGSGSEANQLAIRSLVNGNRDKGNHLITTRAEHSCIRNVFKLFREKGYEVSFVPLNVHGRVKLDELEQLIREDTILASIHHANGETGTIQDIASIGRMLHQHDVLFHSDCVQSFGRIPIDVNKAHLDSISISAHKIYGPKGIGLAYLNPEKSWKPVIPGTDHEKGFRPGTVDTPAVAAFLASAKKMMEQMENYSRREEQLRERFLGRLQATDFDIVIEGDPNHRLPNILGFRIRGMEGQYAMIECNRHGLAISTGSACSVGSDKPPATMVALGRDEQEAREFVRVSFGRQTTGEEIDEATGILQKVLEKHFNMIKR